MIELGSGRQRDVFRLALIVLVVVWNLSVPSQALEIAYCQGGACICISWGWGGGTYTEVRCPEPEGPLGGDGGWTTTPPPSGPPPNNDGSWNGGGSILPTTPAAGQPLPQAWGPLVTRVNTTVRDKLRGEWNTDVKPYRYVPTECTMLFDNNKLGMKAVGLFTSSVLRHGQQQIASNGSQPCLRPNTYAWTECCDHSPFIFLCDAWATQSTNDASLSIIHELLHVAGQTEDTTSSAGPGNPPTSEEIDQVVRLACGGA